MVGPPTEIAIMLLAALCLSLAPTPDLPQVPLHHEIAWATVETRSGPKPLELDLELPSQAGRAFPVVLVVDPSGAGTARERAHAATVAALLARGIAVATTTIRTGDEADFPAQVHDLKGAVRFLRANALRLRLDPGRIGVWGEGDGATLAALLGTSGHVAALEGAVGGNVAASSRIQAVVEVSGLLDFEEEHAAPGSENVPTPRLVGLSISARDQARSLARERAQADVRERSPLSDEVDPTGAVQRPVREARERGAQATRDARPVAALSRCEAAPETRVRTPDAPEDSSLFTLAPDAETIAPADALRFASPRHHVSADDPPMLLAEAVAAPGAGDSQARAMRGRLLAHGVPVVLAEWPASESGIGTERLPRSTLAQAADFVRSVLVNSSSIAPIGAGIANGAGMRASIWSTGIATPSTPFWLHVEGALPNANGAFVLSDVPDEALTAAGVAFLSPPLVRLPSLATDARGNAVQSFAVPAEWVGLTLFVQFEYADRRTAGASTLLSGAGRVSICR